MKIDSNLFDMVVFNGVDRIRHSGFINSVTINFSSPPRIPNPSITLYLLISENDNPNMFLVVGEQPLPPNRIQQGRIGVQTIVLDNPLECFEKQFVALAFARHSGTPASIKDRNEHSVNLDYFCNLKNRGRSIDFINYSNKGAAFSFIIEPSKSKILLFFSSLICCLFFLARSNHRSAPQTQRRLLETETITGTTSDELLTSIVTTQNKFEERDNMLRESSIAEDYWKQVIDKIKKQEAKMVEEQNDSINSSSSSKSSVTCSE
jgi:hypothetical protein